MANNKFKGKRTVGGVMGVVLVAVLVLAQRHFLPPTGTASTDQSERVSQASAQASPNGTDSGNWSNSAPSSNRSTALSTDGKREVRRLFEQKTSDTIVEVSAEVIRILPDDNVGSRHQKFIVRIDRGLTVLISHNIDLAPRVPLREGETVSIKGEYEWTDKGGVIHWTHHDPKNWREGGWIKHNGSIYQ